MNAGSPGTDLRIGIVGCGLMGAGIAEICARAGLGSVTALDVDRARVAAGRDRIAGSLAKAVAAQKLGPDERDVVLDRIVFSVDYEDLAECDLIVEAVIEAEEEKVNVFHLLDKVLEHDAILASNTSSIPIMKLAMATTRPESVLGLHFFNPVPVLSLVEVIPSLLTAPSTIERAEGFARDVLGKQLIRCQDRAGFVVNALLVPYLLSAVRMLESGFASAEDIDVGMVQGCAHPMGPLALTDLIGLDTTMAVAQSMYDEFKEPLYAPPPMLSRMVDAGLLGRKTGRGFYEYAH